MVKPLIQVAPQSLEEAARRLKQLREQIKALEAQKEPYEELLKEEAKNHENEKFMAGVYEVNPVTQNRRSISVDDAIATFGLEAVQPLIKTSTSVSLRIERKD